MDDFQKRIAAALDARREELGWSRADLARKAEGVNITTLYQFFNCRQSTSISTLGNIIDALGVELIVRPIGTHADKSKGEVLCQTESQFGKERPSRMDEEIKKRTEYLYMTVEESAFFRTGFKNGAAWAKSVTSFFLNKFVESGTITQDFAERFREDFESELW